MSGVVVFAMYRPHEGKRDALKALVEIHLPTLREYEMVTDRPTMLLEAGDVGVGGFPEGGIAFDLGENDFVGAVTEAFGEVSERVVDGMAGWSGGELRIGRSIPAAAAEQGDDANQSD